MHKLQLTLACGRYDRTQPLIDGRVRPEGVDLTFLPLRPGETFWRMLNHGEFDVSEMSLSSYTILRSEGDTRFIAIPVFPSRVFRHSALYVLVPVPNCDALIDWTVEKERFSKLVRDTLVQRMDLSDLRNHICAEKIITPDDWRDEYAVYKGATFNLSHKIGQMLYLRPHNRFEETEHCYLVGGGTHPGSGVPTIIESGRIAANMISAWHDTPSA